jgi:hypothetical protein
MLGPSLGAIDKLGEALGTALGTVLGFNETLGNELGLPLGDSLGMLLGTLLGVTVGRDEGKTEGCELGAAVVVGAPEAVGNGEGASDLLGDAVGSKSRSDVNDGGRDKLCEDPKPAGTGTGAATDIGTGIDIDGAFTGIDTSLGSASAVDSSSVTV